MKSSWRATASGSLASTPGTRRPLSSLKGNLRLLPTPALTRPPGDQTTSRSNLILRSNYSSYCDLAKNLLDHAITLHFAEYPLDFNENLKGLFSFHIIVIFLFH